MTNGRTPFMDVAETGAAIERDALAGSRALLEALPYPVLQIDSNHRVEWANQSARATYEDCEGTCFQVSHGYQRPCQLAGERCPKLPAEESMMPASAYHAHSTQHGTEFFMVTAIPIVGGGVLELHVPVEDVWARDQLTGLYSRDFFERLASRQLALLQRLGTTYSIIMIDLDFFKRVNDNHGHAAGDAVLHAVGAAIAGQIREADTAGRWGGEEFCVFLPDTDMDGAVESTLRIQRAIRALAFDPPLTGYRQTASFGVHAAVRDEPLHDAIANADTALYRAKERGRDRFEQTKR